MRILIINANRFDRNGMSTVIMSYYNELKKNKIHADLIANEVIERDFRNSFESNRDKVFLLHNRKKNPLGYALKVKKILENGNYDIVHIHGNSATLILELFAIRKIKIIKVVHGHGVTTSHPIIHSMFKNKLNALCHYRFAASEEAGKFLFGKNKFYVIPNGIKTGKYVFDKKTRASVRKNLNLENNDKLIVQIGAFTYQKNYEFTVKLINSLKEFSNIHFLLLGNGPEKEKIKNEIKKFNLEKSVLVHDAVSNVNDFLMAADGVIFPSRFEPFGIVALEAQASGVPVAVSEFFVKKLNLSPIISYLPLNLTLWKKWIVNLKTNDFHNTIQYVELIKNSDYDIENNAQKMIDFYKKMLRYS